MGNAIWGVHCEAFLDDNCSNKIGDSGNKHGDPCLENVNGAKSMNAIIDAEISKPDTMKAHLDSYPV
jgi:hypothetical protein